MQEKTIVLITKLQKKLSTMHKAKYMQLCFVIKMLTFIFLNWKITIGKCIPA